MIHPRRLFVSVVTAGLLIASIAPPVWSQVVNRSAMVHPSSLPLAAETWSFDLTTTGQDLHWTSPTSVDPNALGYDVTFELTALEVTVSFLGIPFGPFDLLAEIPPELKSASALAPGPAPLQIVDIHVEVPPAPATPAVTGDVSMGLNASGSGFFDFANVTLGTVTIDVPIFGQVEAQIESVRFAGITTIGESQWFPVDLPSMGTNGPPLLWGAGELLGNDPMSITLVNALPSSFASLVVGFGYLGSPLKGGILVPTPDLFVLGIPTGAQGLVNLSSTWPTGVPPGFTFYVQAWVEDPGGVAGVASSNGLAATTP